MARNIRSLIFTAYKIGKKSSFQGLNFSSLSPNWHFLQFFLCHWELESLNCRYTLKNGYFRVESEILFKKVKFRHKNNLCLDTITWSWIFQPVYRTLFSIKYTGDERMSRAEPAKGAEIYPAIHQPKPPRNPYVKTHAHSHATNRASVWKFFRHHFLHNYPTWIKLRNILT